MLTLWHWHGYGGIGDPGWLIRVPGSTHALAYVWRGDNAGPPTMALEVVKNIASVKAHPLMAKYPKAKIITSTFDNISAVWNKEAQLPVVTQELADTWIWGTGSDPVKVAKMRALHRLRTSCVSRTQAISRHSWPTPTCQKCPICYCLGGLDVSSDRWRVAAGGGQGAALCLQ